MFRSTESIEEATFVSQRKLTVDEIASLKEALTSNVKKANIRLREGEYQFTLAKAIGESQLELMFPDVKDIVKRISGDRESEDVQVIRKIQTILKKMERSNVVKILPKKKPWELQRYMLLSFRFQDADNSTVVLATEQQIRQSQETLQSYIRQRGASTDTRRANAVKIAALAMTLFASYGAVLWSLSGSAISSSVFIPAFCAATVAAIALGRILGR
jgi:hypothetical protein